MSAHNLFLQYISLEIQFLIQSHAAITLFPLYLCSSSTTHTKCQVQNQRFSHSSGCSVIPQTVTRIVSSRRQSHRIQLLILSPLSILNGARVPSKHAFRAGSREPQQNLVLSTLPDRSVNYWNIQPTISQLPQCYFSKPSVLAKGATR